MTTQFGTAIVPGGQLYYEATGVGDSLVLIHGFGLDRRAWDDQVTALAQGWQVIRYDARGFGKSTVPTSERYSHADDLKCLLDHMGIARSCLVGLSMGGGIAVSFALAYPDRVSGLILVDPALISYQWSDEWRSWWQAIEAEGAQRGAAAANERWFQHPVFALARENPATAARLKQMIADYSGWHWINRDRQRRNDPPDMQRLDQIVAPTLIINGERDLPDFHAMARILQRSIPDAQTVVIPRVGHLTNMEAPADVNELIQPFLKTLPQSRFGV
ncbi:MAG: alpha/beta fold hydrolase [Anaerolineae bacterium]|nr:alpha/beta fold hydrolase [Anaerolineae bacterium]